MRTPKLDGIVDRCLHINFRLDAARAADFLPPAAGRVRALAGSCLIRLGDARPAAGAFGFETANAAHRLAVLSDDGRLRARAFELAPEGGAGFFAARFAFAEARREIEFALLAPGGRGVVWLRGRLAGFFEDAPAGAKRWRLAPLALEYSAAGCAVAEAPPADPFAFEDAITVQNVAREWHKAARFAVK